MHFANGSIDSSGRSAFVPVPSVGLFFFCPSMKEADEC